jgi:hypothetical protein
MTVLDLISLAVALTLFAGFSFVVLKISTNPD